jgi:hypothetical protein
MNIFISWSGQLSKLIGEVFKDWMPTVIQSIKPYFTPSDIEKGAKWENEISKKLSECNVGIIILTKENIKSQWIMFEAGALSNKLDKSKVCPILFGLDNTDLTGPLSTFQTTKFTQDDIKQLMSNINSQCGDNKLIEKVFNEVFKVFWPHLEEKINNVITKHIETSKDGEKSIKRPDREILEEILELTRLNSRKKNDLIHKRETSDFLGIPDENRIKLIQMISSHLKSNKTRLKEFPLLEPEDICAALEKDTKVRELAGNRDALLNLIDEYLKLKLV